jgi:hypothetical protein
MQTIIANHNNEKFTSKNNITTDMVDTIVDSPTRAMSGGETLFVYQPGKPLDISIKEITDINIAKTTRTNGLINCARAIGAVPRMPTMSNCYCRLSKLDKDSPKLRAKLEGIAKHAYEQVIKYMPETKPAFDEFIDKCKSEYIYPGTGFSSGVINRSNPLGAHKDRANYKGTASYMRIWEKHTQGGLLVMPEYNIGIKPIDGYELIFKGREIWHGVTSITNLGPKSYRYSMVLYAMSGITKCLSIEEEIKHFRKETTDRLLRKAKMIKQIKGN